jgi:putative ABC transport system permease protein
MFKVAVRGVLAHKVRLALTALSIVLGVGFVVGTYVLTDTINRTFSDVFTEATKGVDVAVRSREAFTGQAGEQRAPVPASLLDEVQAVDGVEVAEGSMLGYAQLVAKDGSPVTTGGAPTLGFSMNEAPELREATALRRGELPVRADEVVVDANTADEHGFAVGGRVRILFQGPPGEFRISGIIGFGSADNLAGATLAGFTPDTAARVLNRTDRYDEIDIVAGPGVSEEELRDRVADVVGPSYQTLTGSQLADESARAVGQFTRFINYALLTFAFIALFVGSFLIVNTFSIILAQRTRELALLRCIGAGQLQVLGMVLIEALIIGLVAAVVGLGVGVLVAIGLRGVFATVGAELPAGGLVVEPRTILVGLVVGLAVTLLASLVPALKAIRTPPVAALREQVIAPRTKAGWLRTTIGTLVTLAGVALLFAGLYVLEDNELITIGVGAVVLFLGIAVLSPLVARPLARLLGWPFARWAGQPGVIARGNAMRSPRRTASTAAALMIGLALVSLVTIFADSIKRSVSNTLEETIAADYILTGPSVTAQGFSPELVAELGRQGEIDSAAGLRLGVAKIDGADQQLYGIDPVAYDRTVRTVTDAGRITDLAAGGIAVRADLAQRHGWRVGDRVPMTFPLGGAAHETVRAIYRNNEINGPLLLSMRDYQRHYADQLDLIALVKAAPGTPADLSRDAVERVVAGFPGVQVRDQAQYKEEQFRQINQLLVFFYLLLALAVIIAFIGIVNTLALSVLERVRELGLLRALGMTRSQLRSMIRWEAVIIAVLGAVLGLAVGTFLGWTLVRALRDQGITEFGLPVGSLLIFVAAAAVAGVLAAVLPGRRAARLDILRAITTE